MLFIETLKSAETLEALTVVLLSQLIFSDSDQSPVVAVQTDRLPSEYSSIFFLMFALESPLFPAVKDR